MAGLLMASVAISMPCKTCGPHPKPYHSLPVTPMTYSFAACPNSGVIATNWGYRPTTPREARGTELSESSPGLFALGAPSRVLARGINHDLGKPTELTSCHYM